VSDRAYACPGYGQLLGGAGLRPSVPPGIRSLGSAYSYKYKSKKTIFCLPLVHIIYGPAWLIGFRPAKDFIAIGNIVVGVIAIGGFAAGIITLAGIGQGLFCVEGIAIGLGVGIGGISTGYLVVGGLAIGVHAVGGLGIGVHALQNNPHLLDSLRKLFPK
jgi:hypothetical protein